MTVRAAGQEHSRTRVNTLEEGMLADLIVLDRNPFKIPITPVHQTKVQIAVIDGEVVYRANE